MALPRLLGMEAVRQLQLKQSRLGLPRGYSTRLVLIHVNGVTPEVMQSQMVDHIVDFSQLLGELCES